MIAGGQLHHIQPDHLGTPRKVVQSSNNTVIWDWAILDNPFGENEPHPDPDGNEVSFIMNLRFPGQYYDTETGLHYNYFRDYEPGTGRYVESDPIGLAAGTSTYSYVAANPLGLIDPFGLTRKYVGLGENYTGGIDTFDVDGQASFEIHVYDSRGREVGLYGPDGWFDKHGKKGRPDGLPDSVEAQCKGKAIDIGRRMNLIPPQGRADISGSKWKKFFEHCR